MKKTIIFSLPGNIKLTQALANKLAIEMGKAEIREFPDGESYIRVDSDVKNKTVILVCTLDHPNSKILPLLFMARTLNDLGAKRICLIAPYLPYMRQDKSFHPGEAISSLFFAQLLSSLIDSLITIDPHLHRIHKLSEIYTIPCLLTLHATKKIADWIQHHMKDPILIGPDEESKQWIAEIADFNNLPFVIGQKKRLGDRQVMISLPEIKNLNHVPILVDDVISTGVSMLETLKQLTSRGFKNSVCIGVHALFDKETENKLTIAGAKQIITCNTIPHSTNKIDISDIIAKGIVELC
ncbi:ribose-phosphate pyrophosphokinase [Legionella maioricensis]|uniref:ribose-phosphate diphosphokinase n=1 Tax=Legionella maioricensis TaxID=2896528 RepID=A0A9X2IC10_9GAMM|nr:ribose-phosphate pyrophosphokinase [Legionella maioricensis]MCL9684965.1 ribose-phosphate pyrophosphokinase [Legionella maioricensis]MCL9688203.1 ribose-phosphate pyrophosphokinase [Legionella maioricensis]